MTLTSRHVTDVCLLGHIDKSRTCRYLSQDELQDGKWYCQKLRPLAKEETDKRIEKMRGAKNVPAGDNCPGYPLLKHVDQGYDLA